VLGSIRGRSANPSIRPPNARLPNLNLDSTVISPHWPNALTLGRNRSVARCKRNRRSIVQRLVTTVVARDFFQTGLP
jgi:hypothetical protein